MLNRSQICLQSVTSKLKTIRQPSGKIVNEDPRRDAIARPSYPGRNQLGIGINCGPGPHVASKRILGSDVGVTFLAFA